MIPNARSLKHMNFPVFISDVTVSSPIWELCIGFKIFTFSVKLNKNLPINCPAPSTATWSVPTLFPPNPLNITLPRKLLNLYYETTVSQEKNNNTLKLTVATKEHALVWCDSLS